MSNDYYKIEVLKYSQKLVNKQYFAARFPNFHKATATVKPGKTKFRLAQRANSIHSLYVQHLSLYTYFNSLSSFFPFRIMCY